MRQTTLTLTVTVMVEVKISTHDKMRKIALESMKEKRRERRQAGKGRLAWC